MMSKKKEASIFAGSRALTMAWLLVSAALAYPFFKLLINVGFNQGLAGMAVFVCICLLYDIPYRARVKAQHQADMIRTNQWRNRAC